MEQLEKIDHSENNPYIIAGSSLELKTAEKTPQKFTPEDFKKIVEEITKKILREKEKNKVEKTEE